MANPRVLFAKMDFWQIPHSTAELPRPIQKGHVRNDELNFVPYRDKFLRAFVRPSGKKKPREIKIERLDKAAKQDKFIDNVLVIFFAKPDERTKGSKELRVVGWIKNAKVFRKPETDEFPLRGIDGKERGYNIEGMVANATLLPDDERQHTISWPGRQWLKRPANNEVQQVVKYVQTYNGIDLLTTPDNSPEMEEEKIASAGFRADAKSRRAIEEYSVSAAKHYYESDRGYIVKKKGKPYDLHCSHPKTGEVVIVEVKGTTLSGQWVILTRNEVDQSHLLDHPGARSELFVMYDIVIREDTNKSNKPTLGKCAIISGWKPNDHALEPTQYKCKLDISKFTHIGDSISQRKGS